MKIENSHATVKEAILLAYNEYQIQINTSDAKETAKVASMQRVTIQGQEENRLATTGISFYDFLQEKEYINENGIINVRNLTGETLSIGIGEGATDVYKIEENNNIYILKYYDENGNPEELLQLTNINNNLKTLTIEDIKGEFGRDVTIQYEEGMTWGEWINSEYNQVGMYLTQYNEVVIYTDTTKFMAVRGDREFMYGDDKIENDVSYYFTWLVS